MTVIKHILNYMETKASKKRVALFKTIYINLNVLPFKQAIHFPILCYGKIRIKNLRGNIIIPNKDLSRGQIKIGMDLAGYRTKQHTTICIMGTLKLGKNIVICQGASILVGKDAALSIDDWSNLGDGAEIICMKKIEIGKYSDITWDCQVTDFGSHTIINTDSGIINDLYKPVKIGNYCWIGNRTTVMPGTILPDRIIVASNSLLNKNYIAQGLESFSMIGGIPAKFIKKNIKRIYSE